MQRTPRRRVVALLSGALVAALGFASVVVGRNVAGGSDSSSALKPTGIRQLPPPVLSQASLKDALQKRSSSRVFDARSLDDQTLANLLWAAYGVNRAETGQRTAPTAYDWRYMEIYLADAQGIWRYDATRNLVEQLGSNDIRTLTGGQDFVKIAPLTLILVSDEGKMEEEKSHGLLPIYSGVAAGAIAQNVYLFCASTGLNVVVRASMDRDPLHKVLGLGRNQKIVVGQTIGYPPDTTTN